MFYYTNYDKVTGIIKSSGMCSSPEDVELNRCDGFEQIKGIFADGRTQKIDVSDIKSPRVVDKTPAEIEAEKRPVKPESERPAHITKGQLETLLARIDKLEYKQEVINAYLEVIL